jgi:hypothetical protein
MVHPEGASSREDGERDDPPLTTPEDVDEVAELLS